MATWELNCQSNPSSADDKELAPYLARQKAMREFFERALFVPKDQDNNGLYFLGATTGSGKNYTAEQVTADLIAGGWDESGCFNKCPGRRTLVFVVPGKDNRDNYIASVRELLVDQGMDSKDAEHVVFDLPRAGENIKNWIDTAFDKGSIRPRYISCPFGAKDEAVHRDITHAWNSAMEIADDLLGILDKKDRLGSVADRLTPGLWDKLALADASLRRAVSRGRQSITRGFEEIPRIWPSALLNDERTPHVIACTPQKLVNRIDTVTGAGVVFFNATVADECLFIFDEIDHAKADMLSMLAADHMKFQPDEMLRILDRHFNGGVVDPLLLGNRDQWMAVYTHASTAGEHEGSNAATGRVSRTSVDEAAEEIAKNARRIQKMIAACIQDMELQQPFALSDEAKEEQLAGRRLFGSDDISVGDGLSKPLRYELDARRNRNMITSHGTDGQQTVNKAVRRARGIVRMVVGHLARCATLMDKLYYGSISYKDDLSRKNIIDALGIRNDQTNEKYFWNTLMLALFFKDRKNDEIDAVDDSMYARGVYYLVMETTIDHMFTTYLTNHGIERMPEAYLASIAAKAPCVCMSATWNAPTIKNFDLDYLDEVHGVVRKDAWIDELNKEIVRQTKLFNKQAATVYDVDVVWVDESKKLAGMAALAGGAYGGGIVPPDEVYERAMEFFGRIGVSEGLAVCLRRKIVDRVSSSDAENSEFELKRLSKTLVAVSAWARGVAHSEQQAGAIFTTRHMGNHGDFNSLALDLAREIVAELVIRNVKHPEASYEKSLEEAKDMVPCFNASGWEEGWHGAQSRLKNGEPTLMFINLAAGGFSKNLKYEVPESLRDTVRQVDCGFDNAERHPKMDLDFLYVESPTSRLTWGVDMSSKKFDQQALLGVVEQEELVTRGEIPFIQKRHRVRTVLAGVGGKLPVRDTLSYQVEGARIVAQAVGRLMRTSVKMPHVQVMLDREIAGDCDFSFLHDLPMGYELEQVVGACAAVNNHMADKKQHAASKQQNLAAFRNNLAKEKHERLAWKVTSLDARKEDLAVFDDERDFYLHHFCLPWEDLASYPARRSTALRMPYAVSGYAYTEGGACKVPLFEFPSYDGEPVEQIAARLEERCRYNEGFKGAKVHQVSQAAARVPELLSIREVRERWSRDGVPATLQPAATVHMTPYMFQAVYLGELGESAGRAIFEAYYDGRYSLTRGDAAHAETGGDFEVLDAVGNKTGVWIDFKHYRIGAYEAYRCNGGETTDAERFKAKAQKVGAKRLLIVNVLADEAALELRQKTIDDEGMVFSFPYMAADGAINLEMMEAVGRAIEA